MRVRRALTVILSAALALSSGGAGAEAPLAPDFALKAVDGHNYRLSEYRGEVVALVFWASWCGGCRRELERLQRLHGIYRDAGLRVVAVSVDGRPEPAASIPASLGITFPVLVDTEKTASRAYQPASLPTTWLIDRSGRLRFAHGEVDARAERELLADLRMLLDE